MSERLRIEFVKLSENAREPSRGYAGDAGWDLYTSEDVIIPRKSVRSIPTGIAIALPPGFWGQLISRSSTPRAYLGVTVVEAVIDNGFRGEMLIQVVNNGDQEYAIAKHSRIAQIIPHRIYDAEWESVLVLPPSSRGNKGFGSTGR